MVIILEKYNPGASKCLGRIYVDGIDSKGRLCYILVEEVYLCTGTRPVGKIKGEWIKWE